MAESLYTLKRDLDMVIDEVQNMKRSYNLLDYIAKVVHDSELEQLAQAAQMRRMEDKINQIEKEMKRMKERMIEMEERVTKMEERMTEMEERMTRMEEKMTKMESMLQLIVKHLGIQES